MSKTISLWRGLAGRYFSRPKKLIGHAIVDDEQFEYLNQWIWGVSNKGYVYRCIKIGGKTKTIFMHHLVLSTPPHLRCDHINRDKKDNRRENLRLANKSESQINRNIQSNNTSGFRGVGWHKTCNKWRAYIQTSDGKLQHLGLFDIKEDAAHAYDRAALIHHGKFAQLNFPAIIP